ncbi:MAG: hypothetical protein JWQ49_2050 [Edaphobacter sp.]|nr:hypothetical protein [Edaphobacter sp.]
MEAAEQSFQRDLQHVKFCDMKLHATIWSGSECAYKLNGKRKGLVDGAVQLESLALGLKRDVLERSIGGRTGVEVVADVSYVCVDDAFLDLKNEGLWVVEGRIDLPAGANHLSTNPADIDAEVGAFAKEQIVRVDQGGGEVISGGSVGCADGAESRERRGWRGSECLRPRIPEEPAEAEDGDCGSGGDKAGAGKGH